MLALLTGLGGHEQLGGYLSKCGLREQMGKTSFSYRGQLQTQYDRKESNIK